MNLKNDFKIFISKDNMKHIFPIIIILFVALCLLVPAGAIHPNTPIEDAGNYFAEVVKNHTSSGIYASLIVQPNDPKIELEKTDVEFYKLYGSFGEDYANYVGALNADKNNNVHFLELENNINYSFIYFDENHTKNVEYEDNWKHEYYPIQLMFEQSQTSPDAYSFFIFLNRMQIHY